MNMNLVATVAVKPHLLKVLRHTENLEEGKALDLKNHSLITFMLSMLLTNKTNIKHDTNISSQSLKKQYTAKLRFKVSSRMQTFNCFYMTRETIFVFNKFLDKLMHEMLLDKIKEGVKNGMDEKTIIYDFIRDLDLEECVTFDQIKKANYRLRKAKKIPTIHQQNSLSA